ncbi:hypothetical protein D3C79_482570 [compost metagenome]
MADEQQAGAGVTAFGEQQVDERFAGIGIQRRGRLVGNHKFGLADQCAGGGDPLLLADRQAVGAAREQRRIAQPQVRQQRAGGLVDTAMALLGAGLAAVRETAG